MKRHVNNQSKQPIFGFNEPGFYYKDDCDCLYDTDEFISNYSLFPVMAKEVAGHAALIEKLKISPYRVGLQWVVESMLMGRYVIMGY